MKKIIQPLILFLFCLIILGLSIRGIPGNPVSATINNSEWKDEGPFELSPERGRFALTLSMIEDASFKFSLPIARFATPDLGYSNGDYVSLFAPLLSFIIIPGYIVGKTLGVAQVGAFAVIALFAILNAYLIRSIAIKLGSNYVSATIASFVFLFATPAFAYGVSLYQHHISTFLILLSIYVLISSKNLWSLLLVWLLCAISIPLDYPNAFLMAPIGIVALGRIIYFKHENGVKSFTIKFLGFLTFVTLIFPLSFFVWFNSESYGSPFQLSGTASSVKAIDAQGRPTIPDVVGEEDIERFIKPERQKKAALSFFKTRNLLQGFYTHTFSPDRGVLWYTPVMFLGIFGAFYLERKHLGIISLLISIIAINILLYSMWGDPWGGWAFGSRYLIPTFALLSIFIAFLLTSLRKSFLFLLLFFLITSYSVAVNTLGAITSSRNPPQVEISALEKLSGKEEKYTYERNIDYLVKRGSKSFIWQLAAKNYVSASLYYLLISSGIILTIFSLVFVLWFKKKEDYV